MKPTYGLYVAGVGSAFAITLFDAMRNDSGSALMKAAAWLYTKFGVDRQGTWILVALFLFCLVAALVVFTYGPNTTKEAFVLGAGILSLFNASVVSPINPAKSIGSTGAMSSLGIVSSAFAEDPGQSSTSRGQNDLSDLWVFVDGPRQLRVPETRVTVFDAATSAPVLSTTTRTTFKLSLPPGDYFLQLDHYGYRSVITRIRVSQNGVAYEIPMRSVDYSSVVNILGADTIDVKQDGALAEQISLAFLQCRRGASPGKAALEIPEDKRERLAAIPDFARTLCLQ